MLVLRSFGDLGDPVDECLVLALVFFGIFGVAAFQPRTDHVRDGISTGQRVRDRISVDGTLWHKKRQRYCLVAPRVLANTVTDAGEFSILEDFDHILDRFLLE